MFQLQTRNHATSWLLLLGTMTIMGGCGPSPPAEVADLIIIPGRVWTGNPQQPLAEAVAIKGDRIMAVGTQSEIRALGDEETETHEQPGSLLVPGFIDTHVHFLDGGFGLASVQLRDAPTPEAFTQRIGDFANSVPAGTWIKNGNWDHEMWGGDLPDREWIDSLTPNHPVFVNRLDGHMALANTAALEAAGVLELDPTELEVEGGEAVRDAAGRLTGVLKDNAMNLVLPAIPPEPEELEDRALRAASRHVLAQGVTTVHHMGSWNDLAVFERAQGRAELLHGIHACVPLATWQRLQQRVETDNPSDELLRIGCLKGMVDGSLGSHTAVFLQPYTDDPASGHGLYVRPVDEIENDVKGADAAGLQINVHAIGDRAIRELLDAFERVAASDPERDRRFRIEHAQHINPDDLSRFAALDVIASMQPYHAIDDGRWATKVIGAERSLTTYAFRSLLDSGAKVAFGSDWAVAPPTPLEGIYAAATRRTLDGANPEGWVPDQKISVEEALIAYTNGGAFAGFEEASKGSIEIGKRADLALIDTDILAVDPVSWGETNKATVALTVVGGQVAYRPVER